MLESHIMGEMILIMAVTGIAFVGAIVALFEAKAAQERRQLKNPASEIQSTPGTSCNLVR